MVGDIFGSTRDVNACIRMGSHEYVGTGAYYLKVLSRVDMPGFDSSKIESIY